MYVTWQHICITCLVHIMWPIPYRFHSAAHVMFTSDKPVKVTNDGEAWFKYSFNEDYYRPRQDHYLNISETKGYVKSISGWLLVENIKLCDGLILLCCDCKEIVWSSIKFWNIVVSLERVAPSTITPTTTDPSNASPTSTIKPRL